MQIKAPRNKTKIDTFSELWCIEERNKEKEADWLVRKRNAEKQSLKRDTRNQYLLHEKFVGCDGKPIKGTILVKPKSVPEHQIILNQVQTP